MTAEAILTCHARLHFTEIGNTTFSTALARAFVPNMNVAPVVKGRHRKEGGSAVTSPESRATRGPKGPRTYLFLSLGFMTSSIAYPTNVNPSTTTTMQSPGIMMKRF